MLLKDLGFEVLKLCKLQLLTREFSHVCCLHNVISLESFSPNVSHFSENKARESHWFTHVKIQACQPFHWTFCFLQILVQELDLYLGVNFLRGKSLLQPSENLTTGQWEKKWSQIAHTGKASLGNQLQSIKSLMSLNSQITCSSSDWPNCICATYRRLYFRKTL